MARIEIAEPKLAKNKVQEFQAYRRNAWAGWRDLVYTKDEVDLANPIKRAPTYDYLHTIWSIFTVERLLSIYKSRRMVATWFFIWLHLHMAMFYKERLIFFQSKKEEDSDDLVKRALHIYNHLPSDFPKPQAEYKYCHLKFPEIGCEIRGVPEGPDHIRQYTASAIFMDEVAFWNKLKGSLEGSKPTLEGGGRLTLVSTCYPGFYQKLIQDTFDDQRVVMPV